MALPLKQAGDLAKVMAKQGIPGSISMAKPMDDKMPDDEKSEPKDGTEAVCSDLADVLSDGDTAKKEHIMSLLGELVDHLKADDAEDDKEEEGSEPGEGSY